MEKSIFSERITVKKIHDSYKTLDKKEVTICGWANKIRNSKSITFIELNDGTISAKYIKNHLIIEIYFK